ncbi:MAG: hypothetical protein NDI60_04940 [Elusimicrobiales bacterium]|nr:hypothetical protein [Elusimicrobiales bacterium]
MALNYIPRIALLLLAAAALCAAPLAAQDDEEEYGETGRVVSESVSGQDGEGAPVHQLTQGKRQAQKKNASSGDVPQAKPGLNKGSGIVFGKPAAFGAGNLKNSSVGCAPAPSRVRTYKLADYNFGGQCGGGACDASIQLKHYRYPFTVKVQEIADFMERCDFRTDTPCPLSGSNYPNSNEANTISVFTQAEVGKSIPEAVAGVVPQGVSVTAAPFIGISRANMAFDMSIPFEIDPRMAGRTYMFGYNKNTNNPSYMQVSISQCEGDYSQSAVHVVNGGDISNYLVYATSGLEGSSRIAGNSIVNQFALKAGKRYYLNLRELSNFKNPHARTDELADTDIFSNTLMRHFYRDMSGFQVEFYRLMFIAYPKGHSMEFTDAKFMASPGFRRPGQAFK